MVRASAVSPSGTAGTTPARLRWRRPLRRAGGLPSPGGDALSRARQATLERLRAAPRADDRTLSLEARLWLLRLPEEVRPQRLPLDYPRVANRLARAWPSESDTDACFEDLLLDRRGDRRGFPDPVLAELRRLRHFSVRWRHLIDRQFGESSFARGDTLPAPLLDADLPVDWTPTETIVVGGRR